MHTHIFHYYATYMSMVLISTEIYICGCSVLMCANQPSGNSILKDRFVSTGIVKIRFRIRSISLCLPVIIHKNQQLVL